MLGTWLRPDARSAIRISAEPADHRPARSTRSTDTEDLGALVAGWQRRIARRRRAVVLRRAVLVGLGLAVPLAILGALDVLPWAVVVAVPVVLAGGLLIAGLRGGPSRRQTGRLLDHDLGLAARVGTALELQDDPAAAGSPLGRRVAREATERLADTDARVSTVPAGREWAALAGAVVALAIVLLIPGGPINPSSPSSHDGVTASAGSAGGSASAAAKAKAVAKAKADTAARTTALPTAPTRVTNAPPATTPKVLTPAERRTAPAIPPALGAVPGAGPEPGQKGQTAALRGGRIQAPKSSGVPQRATTDNPAATHGEDRGVTPVKQPKGAHRTGTPATGKGERGAVGEGAAPLPGAPSDRRTGTQAGAGTPGKPRTDAKQTSQDGQPIPGAKNSAGSPTAQRPGGKSSGAGAKGAPGGSGEAGASKGRANPGNQGARRLKAPGALPLATGFRAGPAGPSSGKPSHGTGQGDGRGRGEAERGTSTASGTAAGATVGFAFPEFRTAAGARETLLLNYFGATR